MCNANVFKYIVLQPSYLHLRDPHARDLKVLKERVRKRRDNDTKQLAPGYSPAH